eukprot:scpid106086/ scgid33806/ 
MILAQPALFTWNCTCKLRSETSQIQQTIHHSSLIWNYIVYVLLAASYKRFAGRSNMWTCKKTCFLNGREQQVGTKAAQCSHFTPESSKTSVSGIYYPLFHTQLPSQC